VTVVFQETDLLLIKCNYSDGKDTKVFQERAKLFGTKKVERIIGLQIQGPHAINKCLAVRSTIKINKNQAWIKGGRYALGPPWISKDSSILAIGSYNKIILC